MRSNKIQFIVLCLFLAMLGTTAMSDTQPRVQFDTNKGTIVIELNQEKAPVTVENFLSYVKSGFYDGVIFHRVIPNFMIQGGGFTPDMQQKSTQENIENEANNGLKNTKGSIAMARTSAPHSASSQFFINVKDNSFLDFTSETPQGWGYAVFGQVIDGIEVVETIENVTTGIVGPYSDVPKEAVIIEKASVINN